MTLGSSERAGEIATTAASTQPLDRGLSRYVPRIAVEWDNLAPGKQWYEIDGTLCFVDISGFTSLSERLARRGRIGAEQLTDVLNTVFSAMLRTAYEYGGSLMKFGGDALLLLFSGEDHALRGASAVVAMQKVLRAASSETTTAGRIKLRMSVGVHSGRIQLFCVGTSHREIMITGPAGTMTTTMEHTADAGEILVSSATRDLLPRNAVSGSKGEGWLLRWRKPAISPAQSSEHVDDAGADVSRWMPAALRAFLTAARPEPEHRVVTVGFVRFCGIDELINREGPASVADGLQEMINVIQEAADAEDVTFLQTDINEDGGKIILVAGAPNVQEDDEGRLMRAARRIADAGTRFDLHIGVNRGHVFAGEIGTDYRSTYTVMGDTVNVAARLCAAAWAGRIYATPDVLERSHTLYASEPLEPLSVKGKSEPLVAYVVGEELGSRSVATRTDLPFVGRTAEMSRLLRTLDTAATPQRALVTIVGETGAGKSRLVDEALNARSDLERLELRAEPYGAASPYRPFRDALRTLLSIERDTQPAMAAALATRLEAIDPSLLPLLPLLGDAAHIEVAETPETAAIEPRFRRDRLADVVIEVLGQVLDGPTAVFVEDGHWMDEASAHLLGRISSASEAHPWAVVTTRRPGPEGFNPSDAEMVELAPLAPTESTELIIAATAAAPLRPHEVEAIASRVGGNPLFIEETIRVVRTTGGVDALPDSLGAVVGTRIDALAPLARRILRYSSVLGRSFRVDALRELLEMDGISLDPATWRELGGFLERDGRSRVRFRHAMTRDVAYDGLSFRRRRQLHLRAGEAAERHAAGHVDDIADLLATHYSLGADHDRAWRFSRIAGDRAKEAYANVEAATNYERALESARRLDEVSDADRAGVWINLGEVQEPIGLFDEALDSYRRASRLLRDDKIACADIYYKRARLRDRAGAYTMSLREITSGYRLLENDNSQEAARTRARLAVRRASVRQAQERPTEALRLAESAVEKARQANERYAEAGASMILHWTHLVLGRAGGRQYGERALRLFSELGELEQVAGVTNNLGGEAYFEGRWDDAVEYYRQGRDAAQRAGDLLNAALIGSNIGEVLVSQGRLDEAEPMLRDAGRVQRGSGWTEGADAADHYLGRLLARRGNYAEAERLLRNVFDHYSAKGRRAMAAEAGLHLARTLVASGNLSEAAHLVADLETTASEHGQDTLFALTQAELLTASGRPREALGVAKARLEPVAGGELDFELALLAAYASDVGEQLGEPLPTGLAASARVTLERLGVKNIP